MTDVSNPLPEIDDINAKELEELFTRMEDEQFDRTLGTQDSLGKKIASFGTKNGGLLLVGQDDLKKGGTRLGILQSQFQEDYKNAIENVKPAPSTRYKIINIGNLKFVVISISDVGGLRPCSYLGIYYERKGSSSLPMQPDEVKQYHLQYGATNPEDMPSHAHKNDIDQTELENYSKLLGKTKDAILQTLLCKNGHLSVRGAIILAQKPQDYLEGAFVEIQRYDNFAGSPPIPIGNPIKISKPARSLIEEVANLIAQNLPLSRAYEGARMLESSPVPPSVILETITNAVAHRNYRSHEHILVRIYSDGFDISNPAVINQKMWQEIQSLQTRYHPNEGIYTFLNPALLYEGRGEGIWKIRQEMEKLGMRQPEFKLIGDSPSSFYVRINLTPAKAKDIKRKKLYSLLEKRNTLTTTDVMKQLKVSRVTAIKLLAHLVDTGHLEHSGNTRTSKYTKKEKKSEPTLGHFEGSVQFRK